MFKTQTFSYISSEFSFDGGVVKNAPYSAEAITETTQRLADGNTMIAETGNKRIVEVDRSGKIVVEVPLTVNKPDAHRDTRGVRWLL